MYKTPAVFRMKVFVMMVLCLFFKAVNAQPVIFSSDQWPKRWGRAMHHQPVNGHLRTESREVRSGKKASQQGWGNRKKETRRKYRRTPDYNAPAYRRYEEDELRSRYAVPELLMYSRVPSGYPLNSYAPVIPPLMYPGAYSGFYPGIGVPMMGAPYTSPFLMAPGMGYPW